MNFLCLSKYWQHFWLVIWIHTGWRVNYSHPTPSSSSSADALCSEYHSSTQRPVVVVSALSLLQDSKYLEPTPCFGLSFDPCQFFFTKIVSPTAPFFFFQDTIHQIRTEILESHVGNGMCLINNLNTMTMFTFLFQFQSSQSCRPLPIMKHFYNSFINAEVCTKSIMAYSHSQSINYEGF